MTESQLAEIAARADAATPGPWEDQDGAVGRPGTRETLADCNWPVPRNPADSAFIAAARADVPELVAEVRRLRAKAKQLWEIIDVLKGVARGAANRDADRRAEMGGWSDE